MGRSGLKDKQDVRTDTGTYRYSLEQELGERWSLEGAYEDAVLPLFSDSFSNAGLYAKYRFSPEKHTFYTKLGPHRYTYYSRKRKEGKIGMGALAAVGWQYVGESNWGISLEAWYTKMGRDDAYGTTLTVSYGFNWFN